MIEMMMTRYFIFSPPLYYNIIISIVLSMSGGDAGSSGMPLLGKSCVHTYRVIKSTACMLLFLSFFLFFFPGKQRSDRKVSESTVRYMLYICTANNTG